MMIQLECPHCHHTLSVPDEYAGTRGHCRHCGGGVIVTKEPVFTTTPEMWDLSPSEVHRRKHDQLLVAAGKGQEEEVKTLIEAGCVVNTPSRYSLTPLHAAVRGGHVSVARLLLAHGADVKATTNDGCTPLHWAASGGQLELVRLLLEHGADIDTRDKEGQTPLHLAARSTSKPKEVVASVVNTLIDRGAHVNARDKRGFPPMHEAEELGYRETVELLRRRGAGTS